MRYQSLFHILVYLNLLASKRRARNLGVATRELERNMQRLMKVIFLALGKLSWLRMATFNDERLKLSTGYKLIFNILERPLFHIEQRT